MEQQGIITGLIAKMSTQELAWLLGSTLGAIQVRRESYPGKYKLLPELVQAYMDTVEPPLDIPRGMRDNLLGYPTERMVRCIMDAYNEFVYEKDDLVTKYRRELN